MQHSASSGELEKGRKYFQQSIESFKSRVEECLEHHKFLPQQLVEKLDKAYQGESTWQSFAANFSEWNLMLVDKVLLQYSNADSLFPHQQPMKFLLKQHDGSLNSRVERRCIKIENNLAIQLFYWNMCCIYYIICWLMIKKIISLNSKIHFNGRKRSKSHCFSNSSRFKEVKSCKHNFC